MNATREGTMGAAASPRFETAPDAASWPGLLAYLLIGILLRVLLSWVNPEANDDHVAVAREILARDWSAPGREVCWEAYHAKLFHYAVAAAYAVARIPIGPTTTYLANFVAMLAGVATLALLLNVARRGLGATDWRPSTRLLGFGFFAFWPALLVISSQATNDAFVILFSSASLYFLHRFLEERRWRDAAGSAAFMILAVSSKASGWIFFLVTVGIFVIKAVVERGEQRRRLVVFAALLVPLFLAAASLQEPYRGYLRDYGTPFKGALEEENARQPFPRLFKKTTCKASPGVLSISDAFLRFRFLDMLASPCISNHHVVYPRHRTCFWSQLYGRSFFTRFDQWPPSWQTDDPFTVNIGRACLLLGLLPASVLLVGLGLSLHGILTGLRREGLGYLARDHGWIFPVYVVAFLGMVVLFALLYRGYSWMKVIYLLPALLGLFKLYLDGLDFLSTRFPNLGRWAPALHYPVLFAFNVDSVRLIVQLAARN